MRAVVGAFFSGLKPTGKVRGAGGLLNKHYQVASTLHVEDQMKLLHSPPQVLIV